MDVTSVDQELLEGNAHRMASALKLRATVVLEIVKNAAAKILIAMLTAKKTGEEVRGLLKDLVLRPFSTVLFGLTFHRHKVKKFT